MTAVIRPPVPVPVSVTVRTVDTASLAGTEERKVRAARRFGVIGLVITVVWMLMVPAWVWLTGLPPAALAWPVSRCTSWPSGCTCGASGST